LFALCLQRATQEQIALTQPPIVLADGNGTVKNFLRLKRLPRESQLESSVERLVPREIVES